MTIPNTDLEAMVEAAARALHSALASVKAPAWEAEDDSWRRRMIGLGEKAVSAAVTVLPELGWVRQRTITTEEELAKCGNNTVILTQNGPAVRDGSDWVINAGAGSMWDEDVTLPTVVIYEPGDDQ